MIPSKLRTKRLLRKGSIPLEYLVLMTLLGLGLIVGVRTLTASVNGEALETSNSVLSLSQGFETDGFECCNATKQGSQAIDTPGMVVPGQPSNPDLPPNVGGNQGLSHGFWKTHPGDWVGYSPSDNYNAVFGVNDDAMLTLQAALERGGGQEKALGREAVGAILNASNPSINYRYSIPSIISAVQGAYASGQYEGVKDQLEAANNLGAN